MSPGYVELQVASHYSLLRGASSPAELVQEAAALGYDAIGIADRNTFGGIVRAYVATKDAGLRLVIGCQLVFRDGSSILAYPADKAAYGRLCRLLTLGKRRAGKGGCDLDLADLKDQVDGVMAIVVTDEPDDECALFASKVVKIFGTANVFLALTLQRRPRDAFRLWGIEQLAADLEIRTVVTNDVLFHHPDRRLLQDVVTCIREGTTIEEAGELRSRHADRHLKAPAEMHRLFANHTAGLAASVEIADRCRFSLDELSYQYPAEVAQGGDANETLARLTWAGAGERYPEGIPTKVDRLLRHELKLIAELSYAPYFLTVNSIVAFARSRSILCQGRGSAANSSVCYCLGITSIDPERNDLLFERFVSAERNEPPDIDVDFEHERREEVIQHVFNSYGRHRAALVAVVTTFQPKSALRDVGKVLGLPEDMTKAIASQVWSLNREEVPRAQIEALGLNPDDRRLRLVLQLAGQLVRTPRQTSQHPGGFVLTDQRLDEMVPIEPAAMDDRQIIEFEKDDVAALGWMKVDCLALGMLTCLRKSLDLLADHKNAHLDLATIPAEDPHTYAMIRKADTVGVFQIESRAQMAMLPRLKPRTFYDLVIEVAIVRPGPIQGDMVHPYLRRREGKEPVSFPKPELEKVLGKTLGVPLFQEQAMRVAIECAGFTAGEADQLRRSMATFKFTGGVSHFKTKLVAGMIARGYPPEFAERTFAQLEGFGSYGFPESHAASFALLVYASSWIKCRHPEVFCAALLNSQPMGFYGVAQIVRDAVNHGVEVRPVCINRSRWDCTLEPCHDGSLAVRLGLRIIKGLGNDEVARILLFRKDPFRSIDDLWRRSGAARATLKRLAEADAFLPSLRVARREALWAIEALRDTALPLFDHADAPELNEEPASLRPMTEGHEVMEDYGNTGLTLRRHPLAIIRSDLQRDRWKPCGDLASARDGHSIRVAGIVLMRQRPGAAKGVTFVTLEDETGNANLVVWESLYEKQRRELLTSALLGVDGRVQRDGDVVHVIAYRLFDLTPVLGQLRSKGAGEKAEFRSRDFR